MTSQTIDDQLNGSAARVCAFLRQEIVGGHVKPGQRLPSQRQLGQRFGVGETTASVAMERLAQEGLIQRVRGRGSFVSRRMPKARAVNTIHFVRARRQHGQRERLSDLHYIEVFGDACDARDYTALWHHLPHNVLAEPEPLLDRFEGARAVVTFRNVPTELPLALRRRGIAAVNVFGGIHMEQSLLQTHAAQIGYDRRACCHLGVDHLVSLGHRRIGYLGGAGMTEHTIGFLEATKHHDLSTPAAWIAEVDADDVAKLNSRVDWFLQQPDRPNALCCATDYIGLLVENRLLEKGVAIPDDMALIACGQGPEAEQAPVPITCVGVNCERACRSTLDVVEQVKPAVDPAPAAGGGRRTRTLC